MSTLSAERCVACRRDSPRVTEAETAELRREVPDWQVLERDGIARRNDFIMAAKTDALAAESGHTPATERTCIGYGPDSRRAAP